MGTLKLPSVNARNSGEQPSGCSCQFDYQAGTDLERLNVSAFKRRIRDGRRKSHMTRLTQLLALKPLLNIYLA